MAVTFDDLMKGFGVVTVMNACIFVPKKAYFATRNCKTAGKPTTGGMTPEDFIPAYEYIDTLKIANFTMEGPTKTITGGQYINPLVKYGKTMTAEIQDALGRASTLCRFFGAEYDGFYEFIGTGEPVLAQNKITAYKYHIPGLDHEKAMQLTVRIDGVPIQCDQTAGWTIAEDNTLQIVLKPTSEKNKVKLEASTYTLPTGWDFAAAEDVGGDAQEVRRITYSKGIDADTHIQISLVTGSRLSITDKYPGPFALEGDTFYIDQKTGEKKHVFFFVPQFLPDSILTLTQDAEGDATVFDLNGSVSVTDVHDTAEQKVRSIFYEIREESFFKKQRKSMWMPDTDYTATSYTVE